MDGFLPILLAALIATVDDRPQRLAAGLGALYPGRIGGVIAGCALAALGLALVAAIGGALVSAAVPFRAISLICALAFLSAAIGAFGAPKPVKDERYPRLGPIGESALLMGAQMVSARAGFLIFALAARAGQAALPTIGGAIGIMAALVPAILLGPALGRTLPLKPLRLAAAVVLLVIGVIAGLGALRLV